MDGDDADGPVGTRRRFLASVGVVAGATAVAGCSGDGSTPADGDADGSDGSDGDGSDGPSGGSEQIGSGMSGRPAPGGTPMAELPALEGSLTIYSGRGEALVGELVGFVEDQYPDLDLNVRYGGSTDLVSQIANEGASSPADVFYSVNAGALGALADQGRTRSLPDDLLETVDGEFRDDDGDWIGTSGRARTVPYNTETFGADDIPTDVMAFPDLDRFDGRTGWAPSYGSFQAFVTAMRVLEGEEATREWLQGMVDSGVQRYSDEFLVSQAVADGEIDVGFANHYYIQRVLAARPDAPIATAFTEGDAGAIFNVAGACVVDSTDAPDVAANFVRHLLSAEAQEYFATTTFEYPLIPEVDPVGRLPSIDELSPPSGFDLTRLSDLGPTIELMREVGIEV